MDKRDEQSIDALKLYYQQDLSRKLKSPSVYLRPTVANSAHGRSWFRYHFNDPAMRPLNWLPVWSDATDIMRARRARARRDGDGAIDQVGRVGAGTR